MAKKDIFTPEQPQSVDVNVNLNTPETKPESKPENETKVSDTDDNDKVKGLQLIKPQSVSEINEIDSLAGQLTDPRVAQMQNTAGFFQTFKKTLDSYQAAKNSLVGVLANNMADVYTEFLNPANLAQGYAKAVEGVTSKTTDYIRQNRAAISEMEAPQLPEIEMPSQLLGVLGQTAMGMLADVFASSGRGRVPMQSVSSGILAGQADVMQRERQENMALNRAVLEKNIEYSQETLKRRLEIYEKMDTVEKDLRTSAEAEIKKKLETTSKILNTFSKTYNTESVSFSNSMRRLLDSRIANLNAETKAKEIFTHSVSSFINAKKYEKQLEDRGLAMLGAPTTSKEMTAKTILYSTAGGNPGDLSSLYSILRNNVDKIASDPGLGAVASKTINRIKGLLKNNESKFYNEYLSKNRDKFASDADAENAARNYSVERNSQIRNILTGMYASGIYVDPEVFVNLEGVSEDINLDTLAVVLDKNNAFSIKGVSSDFLKYNTIAEKDLMLIALRNSLAKGEIPPDQIASAEMMYNNLIKETRQIPVAALVAKSLTDEVITLAKNAENKAKSQEIIQQQKYKTSERKDTQEFKTSERKDTQEFKTSERKDTQEFKKEQEEENRKFEKEKIEQDRAFTERMKEIENKWKENYLEKKNKYNTEITLLKNTLGKEDSKEEFERKITLLDKKLFNELKKAETTSEKKKIIEKMKIESKEKIAEENRRNRIRIEKIKLKQKELMEAEKQINKELDKIEKKQDLEDKQKFQIRKDAVQSKVRVLRKVIADNEKEMAKSYFTQKYMDRIEEAQQEIKSLYEKLNKYIEDK